MTRTRVRWWEDLEIPCRTDLFVDADYVAAKMKTSIFGGLAINLAWQTLEYDEIWGRDLPVQREAFGVAVMDIKSFPPLGWAYIASPHLPTPLIVPLDVITAIELVLFPSLAVPAALDRASGELHDDPTQES